MIETEKSFQRKEYHLQLPEKPTSEELVNIEQFEKHFKDSINIGDPQFQNDIMEIFKTDIGRYPLLKAEEEVETAILVEQGNETARERLICSNLRLVFSTAYISKEGVGIT